MTRLLRLAAAAASLAIGAARADEGWALEVSARTAYLGGNTSYEISATDGSSSVRSRLEFPIQGVAAGLHASVAKAARRGWWVFELTGLHTLGELAGTMRDSDWIDGPAETSEVGSRHDGLDIFSTSRASLTALVLDLRASREISLTPSLRIAPLAGVLYQRFAYTVRDLAQVGYGPWYRATASVPGDVATYDVSYVVFYAGARGAVSAGPFTAALDLWVSPFAFAHDEDDHLLRSKRSSTDATGLAAQARTEARLALGARDALSLEGAVVVISTTGTQTQLFYAGPNQGQGAQIGADVDSVRWTAGVLYTHRFL
jgi:outer membrane protease